MNPYQVKDVEAIIREYDLLLMEANRKNVILSVAVAELQQENKELKEQAESKKDSK